MLSYSLASILAAVSVAQKCRVFNPNGALAAQTTTSGVPIDVPVNYALGFNIIPTGTKSSWANILHFASNTSVSDNSRIPAIWFYPGTTKLYVRFSTSASWDEGFTSTDSLPLNANTHVSVHAYRSSIQLFLNGTLSQTHTTSGWRTSGPALLYVSDPWHAPASATFSNISLKAIGDSLIPNLAKQTTPTKVTVPVNYELNFTITPLAVVGSWGSIIHYSASQSDNSRIPAIWFSPGTTQLYIRFSTTSSWDEGFTSSALPMGATTKVSIQVYRSTVRLFLNGTFSQSFTTNGWRTSGDAFLYVSDPWHASAMANVDGISLNSFGDNLVPNLSKQATPTKVNVPVNYTLSFNIIPLASIGSWGSIIHYSASQTDNSRIPAIWFSPGTTQLYIRFSTSSSWDEGFTSASLPIGPSTAVSIQVSGKKVDLFLNGTFSQTFTTAGTRISGDAFLYVSDPWHASAMANVANVSLEAYPPAVQVVSKAAVVHPTGCEANPPLLACPSGSFIQSNSTIQYGRWDNTVCPHATINPSTRLLNTTYPVPAKCVGLNSCQLGALNAEFGDPMPNIYKQWITRISCGPVEAVLPKVEAAPVVSNPSGCERTPPLLECPAGKTLAASSTIRYGRWDNSICAHATINAGTRVVSQTFNIPSRCVGKQSCQLGGLNGEFGDVAPGIYKHFTTVVDCV